MDINILWDINVLLDREEITREIRSHLNLNDNENRANQIVNSPSAGCREKCIMLNAYIRKKENKVSDLRFYLKRKGRAKPKLRIRQKIKVN